MRAGRAALLLALTVSAVAGDRLLAYNAWARATPPGTTVGAAYVTIEGGAVADRLVAAHVDGVARVEFHEVRDQSGISRMRQLTSLEIPARSKVAFAPGSLHLMLVGLDRPLAAGQHRTLNLEFQHAGWLGLELEVRPATASDAGSH